MPPEAAATAVASFSARRRDLLRFLFLSFPHFYGARCNDARLTLVARRLITGTNRIASNRLPQNSRLVSCCPACSFFFFFLLFFFLLILGFRNLFTCFCTYPASVLFFFPPRVATELPRRRRMLVGTRYFVRNMSSAPCAIARRKRAARLRVQAVGVHAVSSPGLRDSSRACCLLTSRRHVKPPALTQRLFTRESLHHALRRARADLCACSVKPYISLR